MCPVLCQCLECGAHFPSSLDMTVCMCGGELVNATTHGNNDPLYSRDFTPAERELDRVMRGNRGLVAQ